MARAGVIVIQNGALALIERMQGGERYYLFPGGRIEEDETAQEAAVREAEEELGLSVALGPLLAELLFEGSAQQYFLAEVTGGVFGSGQGPEILGRYPSEKGSYRPVWVPLGDLQRMSVRSRRLADLVVAWTADGWPPEPARFAD